MTGGVNRVGAGGNMERAVGEEVDGAGIAVGERSVRWHLTTNYDGRSSVRGWRNL